MAKKKVIKILFKKDRQVKLSNFLPFKSKYAIYHVFNKTDADIYNQYTTKIREQKKAKKKKIINIVSFALNFVILAVILIVSLAKEGLEAIDIINIDWRYVAAIVGLIAGIFIFDTLKIYFLLLVSTKKSRPFLSFKTFALGKYYDSITPSAIGGQPFQMLYMNKRGVNGAVATSIPLMGTMFWQISNVLFCAFVLIYGRLTNVGTDTMIATQILAWVGLGIQTIGILAIFMLSISKKVGPKIVIWGLKLLSKMHLIKNYRATFRNVMRFVANYQKTFRAYAKNFWLIIVEFALAFLDIFLYNLIPYFIYKTLVPGGTVVWTEMFMQSIMCNLSLMFFPTPGASGGAEGIFTITLAPAFGGKAFLGLLFWRFSTYYSVLIMGLLVMIYDFAIGNRKLEKQKAESEEYEQLKKIEMSFTERLKEQIAKDEKDMQLVKEQERDKLLLQAFTHKTKRTNKPEIIKNSQIVSQQEIDEMIQPAEKVLDEMILKEKERKVKRAEKKLTKQNRKKK